MKVKKYTASSFKEAAEMMKEELGPNAIVLSSKKVRSGGVLDLMGKELVEVTAALDETSSRYSAIQPDSEIKKRVHPKFKKYLEMETPSQKPNYSEIKSVAVASELKRNTDAINTESMKVTHLHNEVAQMKKMLEEMSEMIKHSKLPSLPKNLKNLLIQMVDQDINEYLAKNLINILYANLNLKEIENSDTVRMKLLLMIQNLLKSVEPLKLPKQKKPYVMALVGPTGVGKTTTIAKIAANCKLYEKYKVGIITTDTYRIAAADQLETFASIANIPFEIAYNKGELKQHLQYFRNKDIVFIDTVGRSQNNQAQIMDLKNLLDIPEVENIQLVLSAQSSYKTMKSVIDKFSIIPYKSLIFSKLDEVENFGNILNIQYEEKLPMSYVTTCQNVPDDIDVAEPEKLARLILDGIGV